MAEHSAANSSLAPSTVKQAYRLPISVVIPAFNAERFIERALASVKAQTWPPSEIIVVSDGSTDHTAQVAAREGARVIEQRNEGVGEARNTGIRAASQPWIAFLDADDEWHQDKLEIQWPATSTPGSARLICSDFDYVSAGGGVITPNHMRGQRSYAALRRRVEAHGTFIERADAGRALIQGNFVGFSTLLVPSELMVGGAFFTPRRDLISNALCEEAEDLEWLLRILRRTDLLVIERSLVNYFAQTASLSAHAGRMRFGDVKLGERIADNPTRYVEGITAEIRRVRQRKEREAIAAFLRAGDVRSAGLVAREARTVRPSVETVALSLGIASLDNGAGRAALGAMRSLWKGRGRFLRRWRRAGAK